MRRRWPRWRRSPTRLIDAEGGTPSRAPEDLAEIVILLIWTARLLEDAGQHAMAPHLQAIVRAVPVLRPLRMGDGGMARFHGGGAGRRRSALDQALAELRLVAQPKPQLPMGFARLAGGRVVRGDGRGRAARRRGRRRGARRRRSPSR